MCGSEITVNISKVTLNILCYMDGVVTVMNITVTEMTATD